MTSAYQQLEFINNILRPIAEMLDNLGKHEDQELSWFEIKGATGAAEEVASVIIDIQHILVSMEDRAQ